MIEIALGAVGLLVHFLKKYIEALNGNSTINIIEWYAGHWAQTVLSVAMTGVGIYLLYEIGDLSGASAFLMGYSGGSGADVIGQRKRAVTLK